MSGLNFHAIRLFKIMHRRAQDGLRGLTVTAYCNALDVEDRSVVLDSLDRLEKAGAIRVDIGGERPGIMILKGHHKAGKLLDQPLCLPRDQEMSAPEGASGEPRGCLTAPVLDTDTGEKVYLTQTTPKFADLITVSNGSAQSTISFPVTREEMEDIAELLDREPEPMTLPLFAKRIFMAQLDQIHADGMEKHRLTAAVLRAAREDGRSLEEFVTGLIDAGFMAYQAGRAEG